MTKADRKTLMELRRWHLGMARDCREMMRSAGCRGGTREWYKRSTAWHARCAKALRPLCGEA